MSLPGAALLRPGGPHVLSARNLMGWKNLGLDMACETGKMFFSHSDLHLLASPYPVLLFLPF